jgi:hypothetical protein
MDDRSDRTTQEVPATLEREMGLVRDAIALVASGGSSRVVVANLHFGESLLEPARVIASRSGVRVVPLWSADDAGADIAIERIVESEPGDER